MSMADEKEDVKNKQRWTEKYRWKSLDDIIGQDEAISLMKKWQECSVVETKNLILYGPPGLGKTTAAIAYRPDMYQDFRDISDAAGVEDARRLADSLEYTHMIIFTGDNPVTGKPYTGRKIVLDEGDRLTEEAQKTLQSKLEELEKKYSTTKIIITVNDYKFLPAFKDRYRPLRFFPLSKGNLKKVANKIIEAEHLTISEQDISTIIDQAEGNPRHVIDDLQDSTVTGILPKRYYPSQEPPTIPGKTWKYWKAIDQSTADGSAIKWAVWSIEFGDPMVIEKSFGRSVAKPIRLKKARSKYKDGVLYHISRYEDETGDEYVKVDDRILSLDEFLAEFSDGMKGELRFAIEAVPVSDLPEGEFDTQTVFERWVYDMHENRDYHKELVGEIYVDLVKNEFKISTKALQIFFNERQLEVSYQKFADTYGYTKNTNTIFGQSKACVFGRFHKINLLREGTTDQSKSRA